MVRCAVSVCFFLPLLFCNTIIFFESLANYNRIFSNVCYLLFIFVPLRCFYLLLLFRTNRIIFKYIHSHPKCRRLKFASDNNTKINQKLFCLGLLCLFEFERMTVERVLQCFFFEKKNCCVIIQSNLNAELGKLLMCLSIDKMILFLVYFLCLLNLFGGWLRKSRPIYVALIK